MATPVGRIVREYIFRDLSEQKTHLTIHGYHLELSGIILEFTRETILIEIINQEAISLKKGDSLRIFFDFNGNHHTFEECVIDIDALKITITNSEKLHRDPSRKFERINPSETTKIRFLFALNQKLHFPKINCPPKEPTFIIQNLFYRVKFFNNRFNFNYLLISEC